MRAGPSVPSIRSLLAQSHSSTPPRDVSISGWLTSVRHHKNVTFAEVSDGSEPEGLQAVFKGREIAPSLTAGTSVRLHGQIQPSRGTQAQELAVDDVHVLGACDPDAYPIQKKHLPSSYLRDHAHLRFRTTTTGGIMRVRDSLLREWHDWFEEHEFTHIHTPILTSSDCEGAGQTFTLSRSPEPFFERPVNLTVSSQLHLEAPTHALGRTYTLSPCFRAEGSMTARHLAEFYMLEAEVAFVDTLDGLLDVVEMGIRETLRRMLDGECSRARRTRDDLRAIAESRPRNETRDEDMSLMRDPLQRFRDTAGSPFRRMNYTEAIGQLDQQHAHQPFERRPEWGHSLSSEHEKWLAATYGPTFITHYPASLKPFYMLPSPARPATASPTVACFDLLFPGVGELAGGSLREHRLGPLLQAIRKAGLKEEEYGWYVDLRRYGSVPHGGWGMGWDRWVAWVTGEPNVRDVVAFPRWKGNCRY